MTTPSSPEIYWLSASALLTGVLWIPYVINRIVEHGLWRALRNPERDARPQAAWANRLMSAHENAVENLVVFASLALGIQQLGLSSPTTHIAAGSYFAARLAHAVIYTLGIPVLRTLAFAVGFAAQLSLGLTLLFN